MVPNKSLKPFFSIITCTRNSSKFLKECLKSIKSQIFQDFELVIIDGESSDDSREIIVRNGFKYHSHFPHGIADAMNQGISLAKGQYLYFLHSDDQFVDSHVLKKVHDYLVKNKELDWVYGQIIETDEASNKVGIFPTLKIFQIKSPWLLWFYNYIPHQAVFMKKSVFEIFGKFSEKYKICMDYEYWLRIGRSTMWDYMPITVAKYRVHDLAVSASRDNYFRNLTERTSIRTRALFGLK